MTSQKINDLYLHLDPSHICELFQAQHNFSSLMAEAYYYKYYDRTIYDKMSIAEYKQHANLLRLVDDRKNNCLHVFKREVPASV